LDYLKARGESQASFARRAGLAQSTLNQVANGAGCYVDTAIPIIETSDGAVTLHDLKQEQTSKA
jgi:DNA-binding transcriptional regulator YdaS (Cro superfamily)